MAVKDAEKLISETLGTPSSGHPQGWAGFSAAWSFGHIEPVKGPESFPYRTATAERVWEVAQELIVLHPELDEKGIIQLAISKSGVQPIDLSPEDWRLLEIAVEVRKNGTLGIPKPRIGGAPGGPFNTDSASSPLPNFGKR